MRKNILKKIGLISKSGFLASSLLNIGAMENEILENKIDNKTNIETDINNNIKSDNINNFKNNINNINNINNNFNSSTDNLFLDDEKCKDIDKKIFFQDNYKYKYLLEYFNDNKTHKFDFKKEFAKSLFHDICVFNLEKEEIFDLKNFDNLIEIYNENCEKKINKFKYSFYKHKIPSDSNYFDKERLEKFDEEVKIESYKENLKKKIIRLHDRIIISNNYSISENLFNPKKIKAYNNNELVFYYLLFESICYMIDFFKNNFPNLYKKYENFLEEKNLKFIFKDFSDVDLLKDCFNFEGLTKVYPSDM